MAKPSSGLNPVTMTHMGGRNEVAWEDPVDPYADPAAYNRERWRFANGGGAKFGSTPAERAAGSNTHFVPGVGNVSEGKPSALSEAAWQRAFPDSVPSPVPGSAASLAPSMTSPGASGAMNPYEDALSEQRSPRERAIMASPTDWRGKQGVSNPPPMTNFRPGDAGTNSLADHAYYAGAQIPNNASLAQDMAYYEADGSRGPLVVVAQNGDSFKNPGALGGGYQQTSQQEMNSIAQKYGSKNGQPAQPQPQKTAGADSGRVDPYA